MKPNRDSGIGLNAGLGSCLLDVDALFQHSGVRCSLLGGGQKLRPYAARVVPVADLKVP